MSLDDLCQCSRTCKRLQTLCENQFLRKYQKEAAEDVRIGIGFDGKLRTRHYEYVKCFYNFVQNLKICVWNFGQDQFRNKPLELSPIVNFVETKCERNLHKIGIVGEIELVPFCVKIEDFLLNVEIVQFIARRKSGQDEAKFLQYCPNVTKLVLCNAIYEGNTRENVDAILEQKYRQLKHFYFMYGDAISLNAEKLKIFLQTNDEIQTLALSFDFYVDENLAKKRDDCTVKCIRTLDYAVNLQHLFLSVGAPLTKCFSDICSSLNVLCDRENFKSLEIEFVFEQGANVLRSHANQLTNLKQLTKIHLKYLRLNDVIPSIRSLLHLKIVVLHNLCLRYNLMELFTGNVGVVDTQNLALPQIEEVQIEFTGSYNRCDDVSMYVMQFAKHWINLKRIIVPACNSKFDIAELNEARENLENACELTIFTNHKDNATNLDHKLVKLKLVGFTSDCNVSPFQGYCLS